MHPNQLRHTFRPLLPCGLFFMVAVADRLHAQSIWGLNGPSRVASNTAGPPGCTPCAIAGPLLGSFGFGASGGGCSAPGPFAPPAFGLPAEPGDIAVDRVADTVWITDGDVVTGYTKAGAAFADFLNPLPFPLTGLGYQAPNVLWLTDGFHAMAVVATGACGGLPTLVVPSFPLPFTCLPPICATDIDYDPCNDRLLLSFDSGTVASMTTTGIPLAIFTLGGCPLTAQLTGLAVDTITPDTMFVTDGVTVTRVLDDGSLVLKAAATTPYAPCCSWPWAGGSGPTSGLGFDATPIQTCGGCDPSGAASPVLGAIGEALSPGLLTLTVTGAPPLPGLLVVGQCLCPGLPLPCGCTLCAAPQLVLPIGFGSTSLFTPIPGGYGCLGITVCAQAIYFNPNLPSLGCPITTNGLNISLAAP